MTLPDYLQERIASTETLLNHLNAHIIKRADHYRDMIMSAKSEAVGRSLTDLWTGERHQIEIGIAAAEAERDAYHRILTFINA